MRNIIMIAAALVLATGCGVFEKERKPEDRLENAAADLEEANREREEARRQVAEAQDRLSRETTDVAITRSIQQKLLADAELAEQAIQARVTQGNVRLSGTVRTDQQRRRAMQIAAGTPGVTAVTDEIRVGSADPGSQAPRYD